MALSGSAAQTPPRRGLTNVPVAAGVAVSWTTKDPGVPIITVPAAAHVRVLMLMSQLMIPEILLRLEIPGAP